MLCVPVSDKGGTAPAPRGAGRERGGAARRTGSEGELPGTITGTRNEEERWEGPGLEARREPFGTSSEGEGERPGGPGARESHLEPRLRVRSEGIGRGVRGSLLGSEFLGTSSSEGFCLPPPETFLL